MSSAPDIRWDQRFRNLRRALTRLQSALQAGPDALSELEHAGAVQRFEYTYELGWKTLKDYLQNSGVVLNPVTPKAVIKAAFAARLIEDGQVWIDMLNHRNLIAHDYDEEEFAEALRAVHQHYLPALAALEQRLRSES